MNRFISKALIASAMALSLVLVSCDDDDDPITPSTNTAVAPAAVTNLEATSINETSIRVRFTDEATLSSAGFNGYNITVKGTGLDTTIVVASTANVNPYTISGLTEGTEYTVGVQARSIGSNGDADTAVSSSTPEVTWAPAKRLTGTFKLYSSQNSEFGSGLNFADAAVLKIADGAKWDLCFDDKDGRILLGAPGVSDYVDADARFPNNEVARIVLIGREYPNVASLDDVYDSRALSPQAGENFQENLINLGDIADKSQGFVFTAITEPDASNSNQKYYAKVFVKSVNNSYVQGTGADAFVEVEVSYQSVSNVAYAGIKPFLKGRTVSAK
jgi:hypothetical protein